DLSVSDGNNGGVLVAKGDLDGALQAYRDSLAIAQTLTETDKTNTEWQRNLSVNDERIGDVLKAKGDLDGALKAYRDTLAIAKKLAETDKTNTEWQGGP